jgi:V/A-type H+/Na+-transporting ATPase subunit C
MADFDYGNARLRAMKARLLSRRELEALTEIDSLDSLIAALTRTAYRRPVETALARMTGMDCINQALHDDLVSTLGSARRFFDGPAGDMVAIVLQTYDVHNLKAIFRGLARNAPAGEILPALIPVGEIHTDILQQLARAPEPRAAIDILVTLAQPIAQPLLKLRAEKPGVEIYQMEIILEQWHFEQSKKTLKEGPVQSRLLEAALDLEVDLKNVLTALRFAHAPIERKSLREQTGSDDLRQLLIGPGRISLDLLARAGEQDTLNAAIEILNDTPYKALLNSGLNNYAQSGLLSEIEKRFIRFKLSWMQAQISKDPLGIGVLLGYHTLKTNEIANIRWIAQGVHMGLKAEGIRREVRFVE